MSFLRNRIFPRKKSVFGHIQFIRFKTAETHSTYIIIPFRFRIKR